MLTSHSCECGAEFCYICGESWPGMHGCPHYGPAIYDEESYNQDGFHRDTGLNREGRTRRQVVGDADSDAEDEDEEDDDPDAHHFVLQHVDAAMRATFNALPHHNREAFLLNLQIQLFEERGITFDLPDDNGRDDDGSEDEDEDEDENEDEDEDEDENENINDLDGDNHPGDPNDRDGNEESNTNNDTDNENVSDHDGDNHPADLHNRDEDEDDGSDNDTNTGTDTEDQLNPELTGGAGAGGQSSMSVAETGGSGNVNDILNALNGVLTNLEVSFGAMIQGLDAIRNGSSSSTASPATDRPATPMDVDSAEPGTKQEREPGMGTPGSWPDDDDL